MMDAHDPLRLVRGYRETDVESTWSSHDPDPAGTEPRDESFFREYPNYAATYRAVYRTAVEYLDRRVATFIEDIQQATEKETTFVITADHGQNLGYEAGDRLIGHNQSLSEGLLHVPLDIVNPPDGFGVEAEAMVSHLQLRDIVTALAREESVSVGGQGFLAAECIGKFGVEETEGDAGRMFRCVYDAGDRVKVVWNSDGNVYREVLGTSPSTRVSRETIEVPDFGQPQLDEVIGQCFERNHRGPRLGVGTVRNRYFGVQRVSSVREFAGRIAVAGSDTASRRTRLSVGTHQHSDRYVSGRSPSSNNPTGSKTAASVSASGSYAGSSLQTETTSEAAASASTESTRHDSSSGRTRSRNSRFDPTSDDGSTAGSNTRTS